MVYRYLTYGLTEDDLRLRIMSVLVDGAIAPHLCCGS